MIQMEPDEHGVVLILSSFFCRNPISLRLFPVQIRHQRVETGDGLKKLAETAAACIALQCRVNKLREAGIADV